MKLIDLDTDKDYILDGKYKVRAGSDYLPVSKQIKKILQKIAQKKQDNDYIKREDAIKEANAWSMFGNDNLESRLKELPSADVVEVVRCKDCIYNDRGWCGSQEYGTRHVEDNDFCSQGEERRKK